MTRYSVVIPAFDAERTIGETIESVLAQTAPPHEVVVVDDGSRDRTAAVAEAYGGRMRVIRQSNAGVGSATNAGIRAAACEVIAFCDSDDVWLPGKMAAQLAFMRAHPDAGLLFCRQRQFRDGARDDGTGEERDGLNRSSLVIRRDVFSAVGDIVDPPGGRGDMVDWLARAREAGFAEHMLPDVLVLRRIRKGSLSWGASREKDISFLKVAHFAMQRKRAREGRN